MQEDLQDHVNRLRAQLGAEDLARALVDALYQRGQLGEVLDEVDTEVTFRRAPEPVYRRLPEEEAVSRGCAS